MTAPVDDRDVAAVAALALRRDGLAGTDHVLTGAEPLTQAAQVAAIGAALGRRIAYEELTPEAFRTLWEVEGAGPVADMLLAAWGAAGGRPAFVSTAVADLLGRAPRTLHQWAADHAAAFTGEPDASAA
ncbi:hypothetical protein [Streptomyces sp. SPB074]|uniref:hypothetical protein n=1 Tax=Streptomyces sp. (strain SPB074) TaxID=465543 RepID=UPI001F4460B4|nr:hypothetical protein [Streptomyces sp. SPB074]